MLRAYPRAAHGEEKLRLFFGTFEQGEPKLGVIETPDGYIAGDLVAGKIVDSSDRNVIIRAFQRAGEAARIVSGRFKAAGNEGSAAFYAKQAQKLSHQLD